ncbi:helix-turn-helix domain-containing protein [Micromonospora yangpuensis]|uniref:Helix-turn-helix domain-containing protein n=1 Tax=Micromonospora yangpuensis TaxID=683228 RepID=A0A1C6VHW9_9ACTN|nr:helix-turn-helix domain-containing protein [Micromonospora yangpuensis]GGL99980.1 transcriptional regulator [Micromonospora yangpuensis]SCL65923.1 Helix-turn-helix domain-containing protein [Micromonospora yangpuensis]
MGAAERPNQRELPIGRQVAQWRVRRRMTQQMLADRLGKSKSWVDKVERGVRTLDRVSVLHDLAGVLRIAPAALLDPARPPTVTVGAVDGVEGVRAALAVGEPSGWRAVGSGAEVAGRLGHAWLTYQHTRYSQLLRILPELLAVVRHAAEAGIIETGTLVRAYRLTGQALVKIGEAELAWLAADRAVTLAAGEPRWCAAGTVPLAQALRSLDRPQLAYAAALAAARQLAAEVPGSPAARALHGALLIEAAFAAADQPDTAVGLDPGTADGLLQQAAASARLVVDGEDPEWTGFGPSAVGLARATAAALAGETDDALERYARLSTRPGWRRLPVEHRAAYLLDVARACLRVGDLLAAGRLVMMAEQTAPAEVRTRPYARDLVTGIIRGGGASSALIRLGTDLGTA